MRTSTHLLMLGPVLLALAVPAAAQVTDRPSRPFRGLFGGGPPPDPTRTRQELTLTASMLGGYDDNVGQPLGILSRDAYENGYTGVLGTALRYWRGRAERSFDVHARGYLSAFSFVETEPGIGADLDLNGRTKLGRVTEVEIGQRLSTRPYQALGGFGALNGQVPLGLLPESNPTYGLGEGRSWGSDTSLSLSRAWTSRTSTGGGYRYAIREYEEDTGFDTRSQAAWLDFTREFGRHAALTTSYRYVTWEQPGAVVDRTTANHTIDAGVRVSRRLSRSRSLALSAGFGATRAQTFAIDIDRVDYWTPSGYGNLTVDVGRSWAVRADYRRTMMMLDAVARQLFATDVAFVQLDGLLGRKVDLMLSTGYANGQTGQQIGTGRYESRTAAVQLRYAVSRCCAAIAGYSYYDHRLNGIVTVPEGFPRRFDRNAVRIGMTLWLPLYGTYTEGAERRRPRPPSGRS
jgi:hypothetical protein